MRNQIKDTFCPMLWKAVFIDQMGRVFACCHSRPTVIGNIHEQNLQDIYNSETMRNFRQKSLNNELQCFAWCSLLKQECFNVCTRLQKHDLLRLENPLIADFNELVFLMLNYGNACNVRCIMCRQNHENEKSIDYERLIKNVDKIPFKIIYIQGGEPLFLEGAKKFFNYAVSKNMKPCFLTNGMLIDEEWAKKIVLYSPAVFISINAATKKMHELVNRGSEWETVISNIQKIRNVREKYQTDIKIVGHMTIIIENLDEISLFISKFNQLGFDSINFGYDKRVPLYLKTHFLKKMGLRRRVKKAIEVSEVKSMIDMCRLRLLELA